MNLLWRTIRKSDNIGNLIEKSLNDTEINKKQIKKTYQNLKKEKIIKKDYSRVFTEKGIEALIEWEKRKKIKEKDKKKLRKLHEDLIRRGVYVNKNTIINDFLYSIFGIEKDLPRINLQHYRNQCFPFQEADKISLEKSLPIAYSFISKDYINKLDNINVRLAIINLANGNKKAGKRIAKTIEYSNSKYINKIKSERKGGNYTYIHSLRIAEYLADKGFEEEYIHAALLHDLPEDSRNIIEKEYTTLKNAMKIYAERIKNKNNDNHKIKEILEELNNVSKIIQTEIIKIPELNEISDLFYELKDENSKLTNLPKIINFLTNDYKPYFQFDKIIDDQTKKLMIYDKYVTYLIDFSQEKYEMSKKNKKEKDLWKIGLVVKLADSYDNTKHIDELEKNKKDMRLEKNLILLEKTYKLITENNVKDKRIYEIMKDLIEESSTKLKAQINFYNKIKSKKDEHHSYLKEYKNLENKYETLKKDFKEYLNKNIKI